MIYRLVRLNLEAQAPPTIMACSFLVVFSESPLRHQRRQRRGERT